MSEKDTLSDDQIITHESKLSLRSETSELIKSLKLKLEVPEDSYTFSRAEVKDITRNLYYAHHRGAPGSPPDNDKPDEFSDLFNTGAEYDGSDPNNGDT